MIRIFADTSYFLALLSPRDSNRDKALAWGATESKLIVTSEYVLLEAANHLSDVALRGLFVQFLRAIRERSDIRIVAAESDLLEQAIQLYIARPDKSWSLTDCTSFVILESERIKTALTFDKHFEQAGFSLILK